MCSSILQDPDIQSTLGKLGFKVKILVAKDYGPLFPLQTLSFGRLGPDGQREGLEGQFGLVPEWVGEKHSGVKFGRHCYNARSESVFEKPSFKKAILSQRAVVPVEAFYEFPDKESPLRHRLRIEREDKQPFLLGAIWAWNPEYQLTSVAVLTTEPMELLAPWHSRSPLVLEQDQVKAWLSPDLRQPEKIQPFLRTTSGAGLRLEREPWAGSRQGNLPFEDGLPE